MFDTNFSYKSATPLPPTITFNDALKALHDFETINSLNPDVRGCKPITLKTPPKPTNITASFRPGPGDKLVGDVSYFEVEDDLPFIPKRLWNGGVKYQADFAKTVRGCDITIHAPGGFTSINHWRLVLEETKTDGMSREEIVPAETEDVTQVKSRDLSHLENDGSAYCVQIISDAKCNMTFATFVRGFLKNSHSQLQRAFIDKCIELKNAPAPTPRSRRPTLGRRQSSVF